MKTYLITLIILVISITSVSAQVKESSEAKTINLTANLKTTIALQLEDNDIVFDFVTLDDYKKGLGKKGGDYSTKGAVESTTNWSLGFRAIKPFTHTDGVTKMNLNNVGLTSTFEGTNKVINYGKYGTIPPTHYYYLLRYNGRDMNAGTYEQNKFTVYWEMGTKGRLMNRKSLFEQNLKKGSYSTVIEFVAFEVI